MPHAIYSLATYLINGFKNGVGVDTIKENKFQGIEQTLEELDNAEKFMKKEKIVASGSEKTITPSNVRKDTQEIGLKEINSTTQEIKNKLLETRNFIEDKEINEKE